MNNVIFHMCWIGLTALMALAPAARAEGLALPNPSFEENAAADGVPDGWTIGKGAKVSLSPHASDGAKAAKFTEGYVLLSIDQKLDHLAGRKLTVTLDAAGEDGAELGAMFGYVQTMPDGKSKFVHHRLTWGKALSREYKPVVLPLNFSPSAVDGRVWIAVYRSNKKGTVYLDHFRTADQAISKADQSALRRMQREWDYLIQRAQAARAQVKDAAAMDRIIQRATAVRDRCARLDPALMKEGDALEKERARLGAGIYQLQAPGQSFIAGLGRGTERLDPAEILPAKPADSMRVVSLINEHQALGVTIWNTRAEAATVQLEVAGLEKADPAVRRQVFLENYYDREKVRVADALTKLAKSGSGWALTVPGGSAVKVYVGFKTTPAMAGSHPVRIDLKDDQGTGRTLNAVVEVLPAALPRQPKLRQLQFMYPDCQPAASHPEETAQDLADHHVTGIEFPYAPPATFNADGSLAETKFEGSPQDRWMRAYGPKIERLVIFWPGSMRGRKMKLTDGSPLEPLTKEEDWSPPMRRAFGDLLKAWLDYAAANGFDRSHWAILPVDEIASGEQWANPPGAKVRRMVDLSQIVRKLEPKLPIYSTMGIYTLPADAKAVGPSLDVAVPYYPYPEKLSRWSPPGFNPHTAFETITFPYLEQQRDGRGMEILSYHVSRGKKDKVLPDVLSYPVEAVANGFTGIGYWAYNVTRGLSWDDRDGGLLDYSFIYDGTENHPLNRKYNVTKEIVVPSIRWEALRLGWQDGQILLTLKDRREHKQVSADLAGQIDAALAVAKGFGDKPDSLTEDSYSHFSQNLRRLYLSASQHEGVMP